MQQMKKRSIRTQMSYTVIVVSLLSILILGITAASGLLRMRAQTLTVTADMGTQAASDSRTILENEAMSQLAAIASSTAQTVDANILSIMSQVDILASSAEALYASPDSFGRVPVLPPDAANQGSYVAQIVYAERTAPASVADEVGLIGNLSIQMNGTSEFLAGAGTTQIGTESGFIIMCDENSSLKTSMGYLDPVERSWYRMAADGGALVWSNVFEDAYGRGLAVTCGKPVYGPDGAIRAVISIGSTLDDVGTAVTELTIGETGYAFVVDQSGQVIMSKDLMIDSEGHVVGIRNLAEDENAAIRVVATNISAGMRGVTKAEFDGTPVYMAYEPMENMPWAVVTVVSVDEVLAPAREGEAKISALAATASQDITGIIRSTSVLFIIALVAAIAVSVALGSAAAGRITHPLSRLTEEVSQISGKNLDAQIELHTGDEIETLADTFNSMTASIKQYIHDLTIVTAEKERIGAELNVAAQIQQDMLPNIFPAFPDRREFDIYATMDPAKEVGGDFYDFFMVDDRHLAIVMADVSGKGVPASLFMVIGKTLIKNHTHPDCDLGDVFSQVNDLLCESNKENLFITAFEAVLDLVTGEFRFVNAGHEMPYISRGGEAFEPHKVSSCFVLAGMEGMFYNEGSITLEPGDKVFLYTDGVTESTNVDQELFGSERLRETLGKVCQRTPLEILPAVKEDIDAFVGSAPQFDDITMLCLEYQARMDATGGELA